MNKVILIGRLCVDPELRHTQSGKPVASYRLAVDKRTKSEDGHREADFISCVAWNKNAEFASKYLHKGTKIAIEGRINTRHYDGSDGKTVYVTEVIVEHHDFCESRSSSAEPSANYGNSEPAQNFTEINDDDGELPF